MLTKMKRLIAAALVSILCSTLVLSQQPGTAHLKGTVVDIADQAIPKVQITIKNATSSFKVESDENGKFQIDLPPGKYEIRSDKLPGFAATKRKVSVGTNKTAEVKIVPAVSDEGVLCILTITDSAPPKRRSEKNADLTEPDRLVRKAKSPAVDVRLVTDEAESVLSILAKKKANQPITESDWQRVFQTEGYVRLKARETSMKRSFEDAEFKTFVLSDQLSDRAQALEETLARWKRADATEAARLALAYLPKNAHIRAKIYPVIKPRENSFVFDVKNDPAIFLYLDPTVSREKFENTLAHELHHIGYSSTCPTKQAADEIAKLPPKMQIALRSIGAFGEGFAMLAAAGGPDTHPHAVSSAEDRARWDRDVANFNTDLKTVDKFFVDILENRLTDDEIDRIGFSFFGTQGPWYTVGWKMSVLIEKTYGRAKLIECICDQRKLLPTYNQAAARYNQKSKEQLALWSDSLIKKTMGAI